MVSAQKRKPYLKDDARRPIMDKLPLVEKAQSIENAGLGVLRTQSYEFY